MAKINFCFDNTEYSIDESSLSDATAELKSHLSTVMNGTGATINFSGVAYNVDSAQLSTARNAFTSHLGTIAGSGSKIVVGGAEYGIDANKVSGAVAELHAAFGELESGGGEEEPSGGYLTFSSPSTFTLNIVDNKRYWNGTLEYSTDASNWNEWDGTSAISSSTDGNLYMRGIGNTLITGSSASSSAGAWRLNGSNISVSGNIENLLDYQTVVNGENPTMGDSAYRVLFAGNDTSPQTSIVDVANLILSATTLTYGCYRNMFQSCTSITTAPELPATNLADDCYYAMFTGCSSLTTAPSLPATTLADNCYRSMFAGCTNLTIAPSLPATNLADYCYHAMFNGCTNLTTAPSLPATTLATYCYAYMFYYCTSLTTAPELPAITLAEECYYAMFYLCEKIKLSTTKTSTYTNAYRIPTSGTGTTASSALTNMFYKTGGTFTGDPSINTTYYLHSSNSIVPSGE